MKSLQNEYNLIKEGKGNKELFIKEARTLFPNIVTNVLTFDQAIHNLNERGIISEGFTGELSQREGEPNWFKIFSENTEAVKATLKDTDKAVVEKETAGYNYEDKKNNNNISTNELLSGYYVEMKDPKNADKTEDELKKIVFKNLEKDPLYYIKDGAFGVKGIGYTQDAPGLGPTKEVTGKYKSSGMEPVKLNESKHGDEAELGIYKSELNMLNKIKPTAERHTKRKAELEKKIADLEKKMTEVFYESKHGDEAELEIYKSELNMLNKIKPTGERQLKRKAELEKKIADLEKSTDKSLDEAEADKMEEGEKSNKQKLIDAGYSKSDAEDFAEEFEQGGVKVPQKVKDILAEKTNKHMNNKETLSEAKKRAIEKHLTEIDKLGEVATYEFKIGKIQEKIEELKNRLTMTESDDMKDVVDKKAISEIKKDITLLEKRSKVYEAKKNNLAKKLKPSAASGNGVRQGAVGGEEMIDESKAPMWEEAMKSVLKRKGY